MFAVYVIKSAGYNFHYIGHTSDITKRLNAHNSGKVRSTKAYRPFHIIYSEEFNDRSSAFRREMYLKSAEGNIWLRKELMEKGLW